MTAETIQDLRANIRVGFTDKRGPAWWANPENREESHYKGAVPIEVARELIGWKPLEAPVQATFITEDGVTTVTDPSKKMYINPRTMKSVGVVGNRHAAHPYEETLIDTATKIADGELGIGSVGTLGGGSRAFVQYEFDENVQAAKGVEFRPFLTAASSLDGSLATTFFTGSKVVVCDNTLAMALGSMMESYRVRHTSNSRVGIDDARTALSLVFQIADTFSAEVQRLTDQYISDEKWNAFVEAYVEKPEKPGRALTLAENKIGDLNRLWKFDDRVAPWKNSAWGVLAATNTWNNHLGTVRNMSRSERNVSRLIDGSFAKADQFTLALLETV
jgi:phage/plasmid-like protein (TIGR03299 family)